jgi:UDP-3-O-[3-hydroxymyristoyl] glucosamine N-acyltransferase
LGTSIPEKIKSKHALISCENPHLEYCRFFIDNHITHLQQPEKFEEVNGAFISQTAIIGKNSNIFPCTYIGGEVIIGDNCYIGAGAKIVGEVNIGNNVIIRENTVIGADGLTTDRDENGKAMTMPQFGGVVIGDDVKIGANSVIARGAIDNTIIHSGSKIDNCVFISHNVQIGSDTFVVGESIMFGSASTGKRVLISGNTTIGNYVHIGNDTILGQNSSAIRSIPDGKVAYGNPAKTIRDR